jgi:hypothetical protein
MGNSFLKLLQKAGDKGITVKAAMKAMGHSSVNSVYSSIHRLKKVGCKVQRTGELLILKTQKAVNEAREPRGAQKGTTKLQRILSLLVTAGSDGVHKDVLSKMVRVKPKNLIFHMYTLRHKKCKVECISGRYYLKGEVPADLKAGIIAQEASAETPCSASVPQECVELPGVDIDAIRRLSPAEQESYLDLALKAAFYQKCANALLETNSQFLNLKKEVCSEAQD